jgi:hypothetical protein
MSARDGLFLRLALLAVRCLVAIAWSVERDGGKLQAEFEKLSAAVADASSGVSMTAVPRKLRTPPRVAPTDSVVAFLRGFHLTNGNLDATNAALSKTFPIYEDPEGGTDIEGDSVTMLDRLIENGYTVIHAETLAEALTHAEQRTRDLEAAIDALRDLIDGMENGYPLLNGLCQVHNPRTAIGKMTLWRERAPLSVVPMTDVTDPRQIDAPRPTTTVRTTTAHRFRQIDALAQVLRGEFGNDSYGAYYAGPADKMAERLYDAGLRVAAARSAREWVGAAPEPREPG